MVENNRFMCYRYPVYGTNHRISIPPARRRAYGKIRLVDILSILNPQQRIAVTAPPGPVLVLAGPGSGKTRVLTHRIAYLINNLGARPSSILAVTFTNKAAREMESRVVKLLDQDLRGIWLGTFHAICARMLRREADHLPFDHNFVIFDDDDQQAVMRRVIKDMNLDEKSYRPNSIRAAISEAKNNLILPQDYVKKTYRDEVLARAYARYNAMLLENNALDFDDLLLWAWKLLDENPEIREAYGRRFENVLVDEFQDTNLVQYELLRHLVSGHQNIFVVGDEDQSIYRWRGADYRNVLRFEEDYPRAQKILLEQNYRSTQTVLDAASSVIQLNHHRTPKRLRSLPDLGQGERIVIHEAADDKAESAFVVDTIMKLSRFGKFENGDFAVMYRTNAQSRLVEEAFLRAGLPYRLVGAQRFYGRREIKDLISYLRLVMNPADEISLTRVINVPPRKIGNTTVNLLIETARSAEKSPGELLMDLGRRWDKSPYWTAFPRAAKTLADFGALLAGWHDYADADTSPTDLFDRILEDTLYNDYIDDGTEEGTGRWENVQELRRLTTEFEDRGLTTFLENLALVSDQDTVPEEAEAPTLLTLHAAKGLEFPVVFIIGLDDGVLPHSRSMDDPEEMAEERRLFYVGLTRAKYRIYLVRAEERSLYGGYQDTIPSRFLENIPADLLKDEAPRRATRSYSGRRDRNARWDTGESHSLRTFHSPPAASTPIITPRYRPAMRIRHSVWGDGMVLDSRIQDGDETVDVVFESVGIKRLVASLANLEILSGKDR